MTKLDKYFISKYDFGVLSLLSDNPAQVIAAHGGTIKLKGDLESVCGSCLDSEIRFMCSSQLLRLASCQWSESTVFFGCPQVEAWYNCC